MRLLTLLTVPAAALALAACGSSSSSSSGSGGASTNAAAASNTTSKAVQFAECMRSHGIPNFPDPSGGHINLQIQQTPNSTTVNGITVNGPAFRSAMQACHADLPGGGSPGGAASPAQEQAGLAFAKCMRSHGVPNFPDPTVYAHGIQIKNTSGLNPSSPAFQSAQQACMPLLRKVVPDAPAAAP